MTSSVKITRSAPACAASPRAARSLARLPAISPTVGLSWASAMARVSVIEGSRPAPRPRTRARRSGGPLAVRTLASAAQKELAPELDARRAVVFDDVGGGIGFRPALGQERARADDVDRRIDARHDAALGDVETGGCDDLHLGKVRRIERIAQMVDGGRGDTGADEPVQLRIGAVLADRLRLVPPEAGGGARGGGPPDLAAAVGVEPQGQVALYRQVGKTAAHLDRVLNLPAEVIDEHGQVLVRKG